jgi:superfamily II DNA/RNA helicase
MASHTGSGKTLAYLLPIVQQLKQEEKEAGFVPRPKRPRAVILGPTKELTEQIATVAKALSHHVKLRVVCSNASNQSRATLVCGAVFHHEQSLSLAAE